MMTLESVLALLVEKDVYTLQEAETLVVSLGNERIPGTVLECLARIHDSL